MKSTSVIWKTVVFSAAMLGAGACHKKPATTTPSNTAGKGASGDNGMAGMKNGSATTPDPNGGDPCAGGPDPRPRGTDGDEGGGMGRGFVLS